MCEAQRCQLTQCSLRKDVCDNYVKRDYLPCIEFSLFTVKGWDTVLTNLDSPGNLGVHLPHW